MKKAIKRESESKRGSEEIIIFFFPYRSNDFIFYTLHINSLLILLREIYGKREKERKKENSDSFLCIFDLMVYA